MADDTRDSVSAPSPAQNTAEPATVAPKKFPKGVVLGKDGKPCRSCTSFAAWSSSAKKSTLAAAPASPPPECPPDVEALGRSSWTLLHAITAAYPVQPTRTQQQEAGQFMSLFSKLYPCWTCASDFQDYMQRENIRLGSREEFGRWMCEAHNDVNKKLGKREFDCGRWEERWRTGWKDGSCD